MQELRHVVQDEQLKEQLELLITNHQQLEEWQNDYDILYVGVITDHE